MTFTSRRKFTAWVSLFRDHMDVAQRGVNVLYQKTHLKIRQCASDKCPTVHHYVTEMCTRVCYKMVHCEIWDWCIVGFVQQVWNSCSKIYPINFHTGRALFWCSLTHCHLEKMQGRILISYCGKIELDFVTEPKASSFIMYQVVAFFLTINRIVFNLLFQWTWITTIGVILLLYIFI